MNGLELSRAYFEEFGKPMLEEQFPELLPHLAAGLFGAGSECFGFDDDISRDHDFEPGFCLFLPDEDVVDRRAAFQLERAYAKLPKEFEGFSRALIQPAGGPRHGVFRTSEFFLEHTGSPDGQLTAEQWLTVPDQALAEATNGTLFFDNRGDVTAVREALASFPDDIRRKKLAGHLLLMGQSGQYNYERCLAHGEPAAAQLAVGEFVRSALSVIFLLNNVYQPYYKWAFRALRDLPVPADLAEPLERLLTTGNDASIAEEKKALIELVAAAVIDELRAQELTLAGCGELESHAYSVNDSIEDGDLRNLHVLAAV